MKTTTTSPRRRLASITIGLLSMGTLAACIPIPPIFPNPPVGVPVPSDPAPPSLEGQVDPTLFDQGERSIVVRAYHDSEPQEPHRMTMSKLRAYVRRNDVGPIRVETFGEQGEKIDSWFANRPGDEGAEAIKDPEARYAVPYTKGLTYLRLTDVDTGAVMETKFADTIRSFCSANVTDIACDDVDLSADITMETFGPRNLAVGESVDVKLYARFRNQRSGSTAAVAEVRPFGGVNNITTFTTGDTKSWSWPVLEGTFDSGLMPITYTLTCTAPGFDRIFPEALIYDSGSAHVIDANPANNKWNVWFDVNCT